MSEKITPVFPPKNIELDLRNKNQPDQEKQKKQSNNPFENFLKEETEKLKQK